MLRQQRLDLRPRTWQRSIQHTIPNVLMTIIPLPQALPVKQKSGLVPDKLISSHPGHTAHAAVPTTQGLATCQLVTAGNPVSEPGGNHQRISWIQAPFGRRLQKAWAVGTLPTNRAVLTKE